MIRPFNSFAYLLLLIMILLIVVPEGRSGVPTGAFVLDYRVSHCRIVHVSSPHCCWLFPASEIVQNGSSLHFDVSLRQLSHCGHIVWRLFARNFR